MRIMKDSGYSWLGSVPKNWKIERLQWHLYEINEKNNPIKTDFVLSLTKERGVIPYEEKGPQGNISKENHSEYKLAFPNTIVANSMNIIIGSVGYCKYFGCVSPVYYVFKNKEDNDLRFFNYLFQTVPFQKLLRNYANGILEIRLRLSSMDILKRMIAVPNCEEQHRIADFLDKKCSQIDEISKKIKEEIHTLEEYKKSVITEAVTKGLDPNADMKDSGIFYVGKINNGWSVVKLGFICQKLSREFKSEDKALICSNKGKVVVRSEDMTGKNVSEDNAMQGIHKGDLAIHGMDTWHGAIAVSDYDGKITRVVHVCESTEDIRFISYYLRHLAFIGVYKLISNGIRENTSDFRSWDKVKDIYVSLPPNEEQRKISVHLNSVCNQVEDTISVKQQQLSTLDEYKKSLIYEYVTGKKEFSMKEAHECRTI